MLKLGEYYEDEAREVAKYLRNAGIKVDIRTFTDGRFDTFDFLEGRMSDLKGAIKDTKFEDYERYIAALRSLLSKGATSENFYEMFQTELDPDLDEKRETIRDLIKGDLSEEERETKAQNFMKVIKDLAFVSNAESFVDMVLLCNGLQMGEDVGDRLNDPILRILADSEDYDEEKVRIITTTILSFEPLAEVYIDEFSATLVDEFDEEFKEEYEDELFKIMYLAKIISNLMESSSGKMDMETFSEKCAFQIEKDEGDEILIVDGRSATQEIARSLEKSGVIKIKGDNIKWKR